MSRKPGRIFLPLDVEFMEDDRIAEAGEKAGWLYLAMCLRSKWLMSDGRLSGRQVARLPVTGQAPRLKALLAAGLVEETVDGFLVCAFSKHNPLSGDITAKVEKRAAAAAAGNHQRWHVDRDKVDPSCDLCTDSESDRKRIRTESESESPETETETETETVATDPKPDPAVRQVKHPISADWQPSAKLVEWAQVECSRVDVRRETANFVDYFRDKAEKRPGWDLSWKRWMREAQIRADRSPLKAVPTYENVPGRRGSWDV